jgi:hypothetical protein
MERRIGRSLRFVPGRTAKRFPAPFCPVLFHGQPQLLQFLGQGRYEGSLRKGRRINLNEFHELLYQTFLIKGDHENSFLFL